MPTDRFLGPLEWIALLIFVGILAFVLLKASGGKMYERSESVEMTDNYLPEDGRSPGAITIQGQKNELDHLLEQIAAVMSDPNSGKDFPILDEEVIPRDELNYFLKTAEKRGNNLDKSDWLYLLQQAHQKYSELREVFEEAGLEVDLDERQAGAMLSHPQIAEQFYDLLQEKYGIPKAEAKHFAELGREALSEWTLFVDQLRAR